VAQIVLPSDRRVSSIPVVECGENLCDLREVGVIRLDHRRADPVGAYAHLRAGVLDRLVAAQTLMPAGLRLLVIEGYRPIVLQQRYFAECCARLAADHPEWTVEQVRERASRFVAPPELASHAAGAAVDLTVCAEDGTELAMSSEPLRGPAVNAAIATPGPATRDLMRGVLTAVNLINCPTEWWHWSYGDRYWAFVSGRPHARYGPVDLSDALSGG
jgi:D-alanyl-D-alanine dipeptidase